MPAIVARAVQYASASKVNSSSVRNRTVPVKEKGQNYYDIKQKLQVYQQLKRDFCKALSGSEYKVLSWIVDKAAGWGVPCITEVWGVMIARETGQSLRTIRRALPALAEMGLIAYNAIRNKHTTIWLNIIWENGDPMLAQPKRLKNPPAETEDKGQDDTYGWAISDKTAQEEKPNKHLPSVDEETIPVDDADGWAGQEEVKEEAFASLRQEQQEYSAAIIEDLKKGERVTAKRNARRQKTAEQYCNADNLEPQWNRLLESHYPELARPRWTGREKGIMRQIGKRWASNNRIIEFTEFFDWCVVNWPAVIRQQFGWMTKSPPPRLPTLRFWFAHYEAFFECYASGKLTKWMRAPDRDRLEFLKARGMTHEQAIYEVAKEQATANLQDEMRATRKAASEAERRAAENVKRVERLQQFGGTAPVHPKSAAAKRMMGVQPVAKPSDGVSLDDLDASDIPAWEE